MPPWLLDVVYPINRWMHMVCTTLIVGGTLFYELVLPIAIEDLKREQQLYVMARARWVWRWVVWISIAGLVITGAISVSRQWGLYQLEDHRRYVFFWALAHMLISCLALLIALLLTIGKRPPDNPVLWMRLNLIILMVAIFLGSATRHFQLRLTEGQRRVNDQLPLPPEGPPPGLGEYYDPATMPAGSGAGTGGATGGATGAATQPAAD